ncbi:MAG: hypothetical protein HKM98_05990 [Gammaproteobacteria bacterium]|nr:hypothetical protein [Gammaproteobacteria bacterium]
MKNLLALLPCFLFIGCASVPTQTVSQDTLSSMSGKNVTVVQRETPAFVAMTSGKGMFALAGAGAAIMAGNKLVKEQQIQDPAKAIAESLAQELSYTHGVRVTGPTSNVASSDDVADIVQLAQGNDYALDVVTHGWSYMYDGFKFSDYYVGYSSRLRLIDVNTSQVVASTKCAYDSKTAGKPAVSHDTLVEDDAAYIKQELAQATESCVQQFGALFSADSESTLSNNYEID